MLKVSKTSGPAICLSIFRTSNKRHMFIEQGIRPENRFWKYLAGSLIFIGAAFLGQVPWGIAMFAESYVSGRPMPVTTADALSFLNPQWSLFLMLLSFVAVLISVFLVIRMLHNQTIMSVTTSAKRMRWPRVLFAFAIWGGLLTLMVGADAWMNPQDYVWNFKPLPFLLLCLIAIPLSPIQTSAEEYIFRGYLMQGFGNLAKNRWFPLLMTSSIFGLMHIANPEVGKMGYSIMVFYIGTGLFLGIITLMDEGMELALGFHAANNLVQALLVTSEWSAIRADSLLKDVSEPSASNDVLIPVLVIFPLLLIIFSRKYDWSGWQQKLTGKIADYGSDVPKENAGQPDL